MSIAAQRFKYLDKETNLPTVDFSKLNDNSVYNSVDEIINSAIAEAKEKDELIEKVSSSLSDLQDAIMNATSEVMQTLKDALNAAIDAISNLEMPDIVKDIFDSLKKLDLGGVKDFMKDLLHVGSKFLCNNLDFLKLFMLGYALNKNIIAGLLTALLLSWLDRYCKGFTQSEMKASGPLSSIEKIISPKGIVMNAANTFNNFTQTYASYLNAKSPIPLLTPVSRNDFTMSARSGNFKNNLLNLRNSEISHSARREYIYDIDQQLTQYPSHSNEYRNLLSARGELIKLPLIHTERRDKNIQYSNLSDKLGSMAKNIQNVDLNSVNTYNLSELERGLFTKVQEFKKNSCTSADVATRTHESGSFSDFDFEKVMPAVTPAEKEHLEKIDYVDTSHRTHDMHPTTEVFLGTQYA